MFNRAKRERLCVPVQLMMVHQGGGGEEGLEHELVGGDLGGGWVGGGEGVG